MRFRAGVGRNLSFLITLTNGLYNTVHEIIHMITFSDRLTDRCCIAAANYKALCVCVADEQHSSNAIKPSADVSELSVGRSQTDTVSTLCVSYQNNYIGDSSLNLIKSTGKQATSYNISKVTTARHHRSLLLLT